jgi:hypothetical protein
MLPIFDCSETYMIRAPGSNGRKVASDCAWQLGRERKPPERGKSKASGSKAVGKKSPGKRVLGKKSLGSEGFRQEGEQQSSGQGLKAARERSARWPDDAGARGVRAERGLAPEAGREGQGGHAGEAEAQGQLPAASLQDPRGAMVKDGEPSRLALSAHAWGEPVLKRRWRMRRSWRAGEEAAGAV